VRRVGCSGYVRGVVPRLAVAIVLSAMAAGGCLQQARQVLAPEPEGGGALSCREIVHTCDAACSDPLCLHACTRQGTPEAQPLHDALLDCGQRGGCIDEECMRARCHAELDACLGPDREPITAPESSENGDPTPAGDGSGAPSMERSEQPSTTDSP
jgi:hypothetical protein